MKVRVSNSLLIGVVLLSLMFLTGCGTLETLVNKDGTATTAASIENWIGGGGGNVSTSLPTTTTSADGKVIALYFADLSGKYLVKEERTLPKTVSLARETINQWIKGPAVKGTMQASVSSATMLRDIAITDNVATVDLSKEFLQPNSKVSSEVALYGLVNTLTQFSTIKEVHIRVEGKPVSKYGTIDATHLVNKASLVKGTASQSSIPPSTGTSTGTGMPAGSGSSEAGTTGSGLSVPDKTSNGALPNSPSSINLFSYPPSST